MEDHHSAGPGPGGSSEGHTRGLFADELRRDRIPIIVLGVGGAGRAIVSKARDSLHPGVRCLTVDCDPGDPPPGLEAPQAFQLGRSVPRRGLCRYAPSWVEASVAADAPELCNLVDGALLVVLVCGLGGNTASVAGPAIARLMERAGSTVVGVVSTPFPFEGERRRRQGCQALEAFARARTACLHVPYGTLSEVLPGSTTLLDAFRAADHLMVAVVGCLVRLLGGKDPPILDDTVRAQLAALRFTLAGSIDAPEAAGPVRERPEHARRYWSLIPETQTLFTLRCGSE